MHPLVHTQRASSWSRGGACDSGPRRTAGQGFGSLDQRCRGKESLSEKRKFYVLALLPGKESFLRRLAKLDPHRAHVHHARVHERVVLGERAVGRVTFGNPVAHYVRNVAFVHAQLVDVVESMHAKRTPRLSFHSHDIKLFHGHHLASSHCDPACLRAGVPEMPVRLHPVVAAGVRPHPPGVDGVDHENPLKLDTKGLLQEKPNYALLLVVHRVDVAHEVPCPR
eukprot:2871642-Rhodomonas_salina.2